MSRLKIFLLGPPRIEHDEQLITTDTRKAIALLACLALTGEHVSRDTLSAFLWPEFDERRARAALRRTLSSLKTAVGKHNLYTTRNIIGLVWDDSWCDALEFQRLLAETTAHRHGPAELCQSCLNTLEEAVALHRADFMSGFSLRDSLPFDDWQLQQAESFRHELSEALIRLSGSYGAQGQFSAAIEHTRRWLQLDPLHEEAHRRLMQLYAWNGQRSAALQQYRACVRFLETELGVSPLAETTSLHQAIQMNTVAPWQKPSSPQLPESPAKTVRASAAPMAMPLFGRETELAAVQRVYSQVGPEGRFLALAGEAGIGKTYLAEAFLAGQAGAGQLRVRCYEGEGHLAYAPFVEAIREGLAQEGARARILARRGPWLATCARLLPELAEQFPDLQPAPDSDWPGSNGRFLEAIGRLLEALLAGAQPGTLWLDDVQWADAASLDMLAFLARRWRRRPYLLLVCWREGDLPADHQLHRILGDARREGAGALITLDRFGPDAVSKLVESWPGMAPHNGALASRLYQETEGLPFLLTAYLQIHAEAGPDARALADWSLPATARDLFQARLGRAGETGRQLLQTAAVIGRPFGFELIQAVSGRSEDESLVALEKLVIQRMLIEQPGEAAAGAYAFQHHKLRDLVYGEMSLARRRLLHRRTALALQAQRERPTGELAGQIAAHFQASGSQTEAAFAHRLAGDYARSLFAHRDALAHYQAALALDHAQAAFLHEACADLQTRLGEYTAALISFEQAAAGSDAGDLPRLEHKIGQVYYRRGDWELAERQFERAAAAWSEATMSGELARVYVDWSMTAYRAGNMVQALHRAERAQELADTSLLRAQSHNILGILERSQGELLPAIAHFENSLRLAEQHNFLPVRISALNNLALAEGSSGLYRAAHAHLQTALQHCLTYGDLHWEAALRNNLADQLHQMGREEESMQQLKLAVSIYAEIGREAGDWQPEIWKLTEW